MKYQSPDKLILGHLNINSVRNKFDGLKFVIDNKIDIFLTSETKLDDSFLNAQFLIEAFDTPYRHDRSSKGRGLLLYTREDIPSKRLSIETLIVGINLKKRKWFLNGSYSPNKNQISHHLECLNRILDEYSSEYDNFVFIVEFNVNVNESPMKEFCNLNGLKSLINVPTCFKNPEKSTCIDLILTNRPIYFQLCTVLETALSDFHLVTITEFKMGFTKSKPRIITYRDYKKFNKNAFRSEIQSLCSSEVDLGFFEDLIFHIFNKHAPIKEKYLRANEAPFITKELHVAIMKRSRLGNRFLKQKNQANRDNTKFSVIFAKNQKLIL